MTEIKQKIGTKELILVAFESAMSVFYIFFAYLLLCTAAFGDIIGQTARVIIGALLAIYGIFRIYRAVRKILIVRQHQV